MISSRHLLSACLLCCAGTAASSPPRFSAQVEGAPAAGWELAELRGRAPTQYRLVSMDGETVLQADADSAAAGLAFPQPVEGSRRTLAFRWKVAGHVPGTDMRRRSGDDFAARVYLTFARDSRDLPLGTRMKIRLARLLYGQDVPAAAICYVWDPSLPTETAMPNAYSDTVMMLVASSGSPDSGWKTVSRDYAADYRRLFGAEAPPLTSIVVATDTDDTGGRATAWFGDIVLH